MEILYVFKLTIGLVEDMYKSLIIYLMYLNYININLNVKTISYPCNNKTYFYN